MGKFIKTSLICLGLSVILAGFSFCPMKVTIDPKDKSVDVPADKVITVSFNFSPQPSSVNRDTFFLTDSSGSKVAGTYSVKGTKAAFTPYQIMKFKETYKLTLKPGIKAMLGMLSAPETAVTFTTSEILPPVWPGYKPCSVVFTEPAAGTFIEQDAGSVLIKGRIIPGDSRPVELKAGDAVLKMGKGYAFEHTMSLLADSASNSCTFTVTDARGISATGSFVLSRSENGEKGKGFVVLAEQEDMQDYVQKSIADVFAKIRDGMIGCRYNQHFVKTWDGFRIDVDVFSPKSGKNLPFVLFSPSWGMNKIEYYMPAIRMAQNGYIVATYTARGVSPSTGINDAAGPNDMKDITSIIDFVLENYPADKNNIGMGGISMGAIRSYLGCLSDSRIKTIAAMSGTVDFVQNTYKQDTPNMGMCLGDPPYFTDAVNNLINRTKIDETLKWLDSISAIRNLDKYSEMERPVSAYMSNNYDDSIMDNNSLLEFFTRLPASAKVIDLNDGEHIFPEGLGCAGIPERTWTNVYKWFDYYLKAKKSDILERINTKKVGMQLRGVNERLYFEGWPSDKIETREFYLQPRQIPTAPGRLEASPAITAGTDSISSGAKSPLGLIPDPSILDQLLHLPRTVKMGRLDPRFTSVYESSALDSDIIAAGVPVLELDVASSQPAFQVVAFLLDVNAYGYGTMISHSPWTIYDAKPGVSRHLKFEFDVFAGRIAKNHRLALVIGTSDGRFGFADNPQFVLSFGFAGKPVLKLPVTSVEPVGETSG